MLKPRNVFYVDDKARKLYVCLEGGKDPNEETTEVTMRTWTMAIGGRPNMNFWRSEKINRESHAAYIRIDGFRIRHIGNFSRMGAIQIRGTCHHITIENCDIQWVNFAGLVSSGMNIWDPASKKWITARSHHVTVRHCLVSNNGVQAMGGSRTDHFLLEYSLMDNNNYKGRSPWSEGGAIKTGFEGNYITVRGNVARNNHNHGLWFDYGGEHGVFENNFVYNAMAGAILNEVTPCPSRKFHPPLREPVLHGDSRKADSSWSVYP